MTQAVTNIAQGTQASIIEKVMIEGDLSKLTPEQRVMYYKNVCESVGLNPLTQPFAYIVLNNKLALYARKDCADQLRNLKRVTIEITAREKIGEVYVVTAKARDPEGRSDESTGAVALGKLQGDALANAYMKAETKAKRRVTLSICGLGLLDETEADAVSGARKISKEEAEGGAVDVSPKAATPSTPPVNVTPNNVSNGPGIPAPGDYVIQFGKKFKGQPLKNIHPEEIEGYCRWIEDEGQKSGKGISAAGQEFIEHSLIYLRSIGWGNDTSSPELEGFEDPNR